jgi:5-methyltetrahydropteroyltriglutamate--homocysteine methyltransferase
VKFGAICAPALASMLWNEYYDDDKAMVFDLCEIINAEFRDMAAAGCPLIQVEEPPHHMRARVAGELAASVIVERPDAIPLNRIMLYA